MFFRAAAAVDKADAVYLDEIRKADRYNTIWQAFAVLSPMQTAASS
jgi:GMP synthase (glutamine-hydrolysing)